MPQCLLDSGNCFRGPWNLAIKNDSHGDFSTFIDTAQRNLNGDSTVRVKIGKCGLSCLYYLSLIYTCL